MKIISMHNYILLVVIFLFPLLCNADNSQCTKYSDKMNNVISLCERENEGFSLIQNNSIIWGSPYLAEIPEVNFISFIKLNNKDYYIIISLVIHPNYYQTGIPYVGDYFIYNALKLNGDKYQFDNQVSQFLGAGGMCII